MFNEITDKNSAIKVNTLDSRDIEESQMYYAEWEKLGPKEYVLCSSIYMTGCKGQNYRNREQIIALQGGRSV